MWIADGCRNYGPYAPSKWPFLVTGIFISNNPREDFIKRHQEPPGVGVGAGSGVLTSIDKLSSHPRNYSTSLFSSSPGLSRPSGSLSRHEHLLTRPSSQRKNSLDLSCWRMGAQREGHSSQYVWGREAARPEIRLGDLWPPLPSELQLSLHTWWQWQHSLRWLTILLKNFLPGLITKSNYKFVTISEETVDCFRRGSYFSRSLMAERGSQGRSRKYWCQTTKGLAASVCVSQASPIPSEVLPPKI